jgi:hypothetical protein
MCDLNPIELALFVVKLYMREYSIMGNFSLNPSRGYFPDLPTLTQENKINDLGPRLIHYDN